MGSRVLNDDAIVDEIEGLLGGAVTLFLGDTRVATSLRNPDGSHVVVVAAATAARSSSGLCSAPLERKWNIDCSGWMIREPRRDGCAVWLK